MIPFPRLLDLLAQEHPGEWMVIALDPRYPDRGIVLASDPDALSETLSDTIRTAIHDGYDVAIRYGGPIGMATMLAVVAVQYVPEIS